MPVETLQPKNHANHVRANIIKQSSTTDTTDTQSSVLQDMKNMMEELI